MTFSALRDLALELNLWAHGVDITVRPEHADAIDTTGIWKTNQTDEAPAGASFGRRQPILVMAIPKSAVDSFPRGLRIEAPEPGGSTTVGWVVDAVQEVLSDHVRVILVADPEWSV